MRHRVAVIGVGSIGERHLRCFQNTGRAELALVEVNQDLRAAVAQRYAVPAFESIDEMFAWEPTAAVIATPAPLHIPQARQLVDHGMHVLIEKPLSTACDGIDALRAAARARGVTLGVAYVYRCFSLFEAFRAALRQPQFGRPLELIAVSGQHFPTYRPAYQQIYYRDRALGGGAIQDALTHIINLGEWLVGPVDRLIADAEHQALPGVSVEDTVHVMTRQRGVLGCYALNQHQAPNEMTITVVCEHGTLRCELHQQRWLWMVRPGDEWHEQRSEPLERDTPFVAQAQALLDAIEQRRTIPCSLDEGLQTLRVNLAALASLERRCWQTVEASGSE